MPYIGRGPELGVRSRFIYTATANQTSFSGNDDAGISLAYTDTLYMDVYQNGVLLVPATDYAATTGTSVVLVQGASVDDTVELLVFDIFSVADSVSAKDGGSFAGNVGMGGTLSVTGNTTVGGTLGVTGVATFGDGSVSAPSIANTGDVNTGIFFPAADTIAFAEGGAEAMRIDASGNVLIGQAATNFAAKGIRLLSSNGQITATRDGGAPASFNRLSDSGNIVDFNQAGSSVGTIGAASSGLYIQSGSGGVRLHSGGEKLFPCNATGAPNDDAYDLGTSDARFDNIHATNGTIQTSDRNEKQDIASLTSAEMLVAARISAMFKTFRWKSKVKSKGDNARTHTGIIAQDVQDAFAAEGLDVSNYALFISSTWTNENEEEQTRLGIRYPELLSFVAAYNEQRFVSIEDRLAALEA
jgi:hypothetical protein